MADRVPDVAAESLFAGVAAVPESTDASCARAYDAQKINAMEAEVFNIGWEGSFKTSLSILKLCLAFKQIFQYLSIPEWGAPRLAVSILRPGKAEYE